MEIQSIFWLIGGDLRQHWLARHLAEEEQEVHCYGLDAQLLPKDQVNLHIESNLQSIGTKEAIILLPLPLQNKEGNLSAPFHPEPLPLEAVFAQLSTKQLLFGGQVKPPVQAMAKEYRLQLYDYFAREELAIANAVPTAEGCIQIAMERLPVTLQDARILLLGYGKVASATAQRLGSLGAKVTIAARSYPQLEQARADGFNTDRITELVGGLCCYDCVVNTVPAPILGEAELEDMNPACPIIDLASLPGGVDLVAAQKLERTVIPALSLPGKVAPATASRSILRSIYHMLEEFQEGKDSDSL